LSGVAAADGKRRLPVLQAKDAEDEGPERPPWHWIFVGAGTTTIAWLGLAMVTNAIAKNLAAGSERSAATVMVGGNLLSLGLAALAGGLLVGRFGGRAGKREATMGGGLAAVAGWVFATLVAPLGSFVTSAVVLALLVALAMATARAGAMWALRLRGR
jgi:tRNA-(ms[2]io[6]A)-hydroxylase